MKKIIVFVLVVFSFAVHAQNNHAELNKLIQQSFTYFPRIKELDKSAELGELKVDIARTGYAPQVSGIGSYLYLNPISQKAFVVGPNEVQVLKFQPYNNYNLSIGVNQLIWDFGKTSASIEKAKADLLASRLNVESAKIQLASQVAGVYYSMIYLRKAAEVQDSVIYTYEENKKIVEGKIREGDALQIDLSSILNSIDQEKSRKIEFERLYHRQEALMKYTTGDATAPSATDFEFALPVAVDLASSPDILTADQRISSAKYDLKLAQSNKLPSLSLQAGAGFKNAYQPDINAFRFNYLAGVTLNVPIFQGMRLSKSATLSSRSVELNELSKATLLSTMQKDLETAQSDIRAYDQQIASAESQINLSRETLRLTQSRYRQGVATYLDLLNSAANLQRSILSKLQFEYQRTLAKIEACRLLGVKYWQD